MAIAELYHVTPMFKINHARRILMGRVDHVVLGGEPFQVSKQGGLIPHRNLEMHIMKCGRPVEKYSAHDLILSSRRSQANPRQNDQTNNDYQRSVHVRLVG